MNMTQEMHGDKYNDNILILTTFMKYMSPLFLIFLSSIKLNLN